MTRKNILPVFLLILLAFPLSARDSANIILVLDRSGSMKDYFEEVKTYMLDSVLPLVEKGDFLFFIEFGRTASYHFTDVVDGTNLQKLKEIIRISQADQDYTDIGLALETMFASLEQGVKLNDKSIMLFITDGKNAPPPESRYADEEYAYQKVFYEKAQYLKRSPWKVMVLGIGAETAAKDLSEILDGEYIEVTRDLNAGLLAQKIGDFLGHMEFYIEPDLGRIGRRDKDVAFKIESTYAASRSVTITAAEISGISRFIDDEWVPVDGLVLPLGDFPRDFEVPGIDGTRGVMPVSLPAGTGRGNYRGTLVVETAGHGSLLYTEFEVVFHAGSPILTIVLIAAGAVLLLAALFLIILRRTR